MCLLPHGHHRLRGFHRIVPSSGSESLEESYPMRFCSYPFSGLPIVRLVLPLPTDFPTGRHPQRSLFRVAVHRCQALWDGDHLCVAFIPGGVGLGGAPTGHCGARKYALHPLRYVCQGHVHNSSSPRGGGDVRAAQRQETSPREMARVPAAAARVAVREPRVPSGEEPVQWDRRTYQLCDFLTRRCRQPQRRTDTRVASGARTFGSDT
mmetsp:Transcript_38168/g.51642  ORF Transcript_38168/g.51642 Transcript_38168/m.51642 type:complete len:208 (+) Transcript_38168:358-981(+)